MHCMKLFAAPLTLVGARNMHQPQSCLSLQQLLRIQSGPLPLPIDYRIAERPAMRRADFLSVKESLVVVVMALGTGEQSGIHSTEVGAAMLAVTSEATDTGIHVRLDDCGGERISGMARRALSLHADSEGMTGSTRPGVRVSRNRRGQNHAGSGVRVRDWRRRKCRSIEKRARDCQQSDRNRAPQHHRDRPAPSKISSRSPDRLSFAAGPACERKEW